MKSTIKNLSFSKRISLLKAQSFFLLIISLLVSSCSSESKDHQAPLKIGIDLFPGWGHAFIAQEKGFFQKYGGSIELIHKKDYLEIVKDYTEGKLDGAFLVYADAIYLHDQGVKTKIPYISDHSIKADAIYSIPDIKSIDDLVGKTIGVEGINSFSHLFVLSVLSKHGLKEGDVYFKNINSQDIIKEIENRNIVAGHTYGPAKERAQQKGLTPLAYSGDVKGVITDVLAINSNTAKQRKGDIQALVAGLFHAKSFQNKNPSQAYEIMGKATGDDPQSVAKGVESVEHLDIKQSRLAMQGPSEGALFLFGKTIAQFYFDRGQISSIPDLNEIIDPQFLPIAMPQ